MNGIKLPLDRGRGIDDRTTSRLYGMEKLGHA